MLKSGFTFFMLLSVPVWAAKKAPETYAATENEESAPAVSAPASIPTPAKAVLAKKAPKKGMPAKVEPKAELAAVADLTELREAYDPVPSDQMESIARRLKLVERIIREHGRAYDYRIHTNNELEAILAKLDSSPEGKDKPIDSDTSDQ